MLGPHDTVVVAKLSTTTRIGMYMESNVTLILVNYAKV